MSDNSAITFYGLGKVTKNKAVDSLYIEVAPIETMPNIDGELGKQTKVTSTNTDMNGKAITASIDKTAAITARWLNENTSNNPIPPMVVAGETVKLYVLAGGNEYGWTSYGSDHDLRTRDRTFLFASSKPAASKEWLDKGYYVLVDGIDKKIQIHTSTADGEPVGFDLFIDTKQGNFNITDTRGNSIQLDSITQALNINMNTRMAVKLNKFSVTNSTCELMQTLTDLVDALIAEVHIDSMRGKTTMDGGSVSKLNAIKAKLASFKG